MRRTLLAAAILAVAAFAVGRFTMERVQRIAVATDATRSNALPTPGTQLLFIYIGSSRCAPSNAPEIVGQVDSLKRLVRMHAQHRGVGFASLGVAREISVQAGMKHLAKFTSFDEVDIGQRELNQSSLRFIARDHPGIAATPQLVVVQRTVQAVGVGVDAAGITETVLVRKVGLLEIRRWMDQEGRIPAAGGSEIPTPARSVVPF